MAKSIPVGHVMCKYYIEDDQLKVIEGELEDRKGKKWIAFNSKNVPDEHFPGYRNIDRVWVGGETLWLTERDDARAKQLFTEYYVGVIKDLQKQIDDVGDKIGMIRKVKVKLGSSGKRASKCFGEVEGSSGKSSVVQECERHYKESWDASEFVDAEQYARRKITMLEQEMYIDLSVEDIQHLKSLETRGAIDAAVRAIINKYWV